MAWLAQNGYNCKQESMLEVVLNLASEQGIFQ